jgi:hypothetical protein
MKSNMNQVKDGITSLLTTHPKFVTFGIGIAVAIGLPVATQILGQSYEVLARIEEQNTLQN